MSPDKANIPAIVKQWSVKHKYHTAVKPARRRRTFDAQRIQA